MESNLLQWKDYVIFFLPKVKIMGGFACTSGTYINIPFPPPIIIATQAQVSKASSLPSPSPQAEVLWSQIGLASREGKTFCSLNKLQHLWLSLVVPCLLTMWGASKSFQCDYLFCQQLHASGEKITAYGYHSSLPLFTPHSSITSQQCRPSFGGLSALQCCLPNPISTKWYQVSLLILQKQTKHYALVPTSKRKHRVG